MKKFLGWIARSILDQSLLYWAQLQSPDVSVIPVNRINAGALMVAKTGTNGQQEPLDPDYHGVVFSATKAPDPAPSVIEMVALSPLPSGLPPRFTLVADYFLPPQIGPWGDGVQWAASLGIRNGDNPDAASFKVVGATHQVRNFDMGPPPGIVKIALAAGGGTTGTITPDIDPVRPTVAYPDERRGFTLETDIQIDEQRGWSRLRTPGKNWEERTWAFNADGFPQITGVGFGLAFVGGEGTATVTVTAFRIYRTNWRWLTNLLLTVSALAPSM
jgi:hypothetical protein